MPTYQFRDKNTACEWTEFMTISEMEQFLKDHPEVEIVPASPAIIYHARMDRRPDNGFNDLLKTIKKNNIHSNINTF